MALDPKERGHLDPECFQPWQAQPERDRAMSYVLGALWEHREALLAFDPWMPVPHARCCVGFGAQDRSFPLWALFRLHAFWPAMRGACPACGAPAVGTGFAGGLAVGGTSGWCLHCGLRVFRRLGGLGTLVRMAGPLLKGTPFYIHHGWLQPNATPVPLLQALETLGVEHLPGTAWCEGTRYPLWYAPNPEAGR